MTGKRDAKEANLDLETLQEVAFDKKREKFIKVERKVNIAKKKKIMLKETREKIN